ncbi:hypothetical protein ESOMN_v1c06180 [Williamsoniiplasma somnilux]|uniref:Probable membrane transporter protein n=1 Tax=Williamsoniiplasma somnilux TaxID=215578 RepID=A0A2K8NYU7_9MOLU|nr:TSUP family transporter [Williamsoniiplasma somnilux]ATZ19000.1 hypothetical protein ESOMN_v1c06180 [Williamsoniiplasma somnilux]
MFKTFKKAEATSQNLDNLLTKEDAKKRMFKWLTMLGIALAATIGAMLIQFLVIMPKKGEHLDLDTKDGVFSLAMAIILFIAGTAVSVIFIVTSSKVKYNDEGINTKWAIAAGVTAGFTDTISVGSFGVATAILKKSKTIKDDTKLPGTLNVAFVLSGTLEASLFIGTIKVDMLTILLLLVAILIGTFVGSWFVTKINKALVVKGFMGIALFIVGILMILAHPQVNVFGDLGATSGLTGWRLGLGIVGFLLLGMIQSFGIGLFAPAIAVLSFLGMKQEAILPIMSCGSALSMMPAAFNFVRTKKYNQLTGSLMHIWSVLGLLAAFLIVFAGLKSIPGMGDFAPNTTTPYFEVVLKWIAIPVIFYVSITLLWEFYQALKAEKTKK